ncbi:hypothetical protein C8R46DRAFT_956340 [Mycena filopes]|nr:hypothetical protein C8R46DRAFT_956340 [Mycena filopes]
MDSPFREKIGTNYAPLDSEIGQIKELLLHPRAEIWRLDREVARLRAQRHEFKKFVAGHSALISPIRQLPSDVLREIFLACIPTKGNAVMSAREAPLLLGRICSVWRIIALSTPRLWASLHIAEPDTDLPLSLYNGCLRLVTTWLNRSGALPLSISFHRRGHTGASPFFDALVTFSPRWKHISLSGQPQILLSRADVPLLESIEIFKYAVPEDPEVAKAQDFLGGACVRKVSLGSEIDPIQLPLPWAQLTTLTLSRPNNPYHFVGGVGSLTSSTALRILADCGSLRECVLFLTSEAEADEPPDLPLSVEVPFLTSLKITLSMGNPAVHSNPLDRLRLPLLASLAVTGHHPPTDFLFPTLISTTTELKELEIETLIFTGDTLVAFLRMLPPTIRSLTMRQNVIGFETPSLVSDDILCLLAPPSPPSKPDPLDEASSDEASHGSESSDDSSESDSSDASPTRCLLPALDTLVVNYAASFSDSDLLRFIRARMAIHPLRRVDVKFFRQVETKILPELKSFQKDFGLLVSLEYLKNKPTWNPREGASISFS